MFRSANGPDIGRTPSRSLLAGEFVRQRNEEFLETVVAACTAVAFADGWVTAEERRRLLGLMRAIPALSAYPVEDVNQLVDEHLARFEEDADAAERGALDRVARFRLRRSQARRIVEACAAVAAADGQMDGEERAFALRVCGALDLDPAAFGLGAH